MLFNIYHTVVIDEWQKKNWIKLNCSACNTTHFRVLGESFLAFFFFWYIFWSDLAHLPPNLACMFGLICPMFVWPGLAHVCRLGVRQTMFVTVISVELSKFSATIAVRCNIFQYTTKIERLRFSLPCCYILWVLTDMSLHYFNCVSIDYMGIVVLFCFSAFFLSGIWPEEVFAVWFRALRTCNWGPKPLPPWQSISQAG